MRSSLFLENGEDKATGNGINETTENGMDKATENGKDESTGKKIWKWCISQYYNHIAKLLSIIRCRYIEMIKNRDMTMEKNILI